MSGELFAHPVLAWLLTWLAHSTLLLGAVWALWKLRPNSAPRLREYVWRIALVASLVSATASTMSIPGSIAKRVALAPTQNTVAIEPAGDVIGNWQAPPAARDISLAPRSVRQTPRKTGRGSDGRDTMSGTQKLLLAWALAAAALCLHQILALRRAVAHLGARCPVEETHRAHALLRRLATRAGAKHVPALSASTVHVGPVSLPGYEICLPAWALEELSDEQLEGVLAHEFAHCVRRDPWLLMMCDALRRILFMQPLLHVAYGQMTELAELAADEVAADLTGDQHVVADSLTECAGRIVTHRLAFGVAMAPPKPSAFTHRIRRLLQPQQFAHGAPGWGTRGLTIAAVLGLALSLPVFTVAADKERSIQRGHSATVLTDDDGRLSVVDLSVRRDGYRLKVKGHGEFALVDDETDLADMASDARLTIEQESGGITRKARFDEDDGVIERTYWLNGRRQALDADGRDWLGQVLPQIMRETGINAAQRAARLHRLGGADRLLADIALIESDYPARVYITWLVENDELSDAQYDKLLGAASEINSDYESRQTLMGISQHERMDDRRAAGLLDVGAGIDSDFELRTLVEHLIEVSNVERLATQRLIEVIATINSDFEMRQAFGAMLADSDLPAAQLPELMRVAGRSIGSDFELRTLLEIAAPHVATDEDIAVAYIEAATTIGSDFESRQALLAFASHAQDSARAWAAALRAAAKIESDHECAETLIAFAGRMPATDDNLRLYREATVALGRHERERAQDALRAAGS